MKCRDCENPFRLPKKRSFTVVILIITGFFCLYGITAPPTPAFALTAQELFHEANNRYLDGKYAEAADLYRQIEEMKIANADLFFNMGNAFLKKGDVGRAILYFERALELTPRDQEIIENLQYAQTLTTDKIEVSEEQRIFHLSRWLTEQFHNIPLNILTWIFLCLYFFFVLSFCLFKLQRSTTRARVLRIITIAFLIIAVFSAGATLGRIYHLRAYRYGVVAEKEVLVKAGPNENFETLFLVHAGLKARFIGQEEEWIKIRLPNGLEGWVGSNLMEEI